MKFKYVIQHEDYTLTGTNDEAVAKEATQYAIVYNCETGQESSTQGWEDDTTKLVEWSDIDEAKKGG